MACWPVVAKTVPFPVNTNPILVFHAPSLQSSLPQPYPKLTDDWICWPVIAAAASGDVFHAPTL